LNNIPGSVFVLVHNDDGCAIDPPYEEPTELHHILPQQYRSYFEGAGMNIDEVTAELPQSIHQAAHDVGWNESWGTFINQNPNASASEITAQASSMLQEYGLDQYILGTSPYR
jgi:hypothetical protein